MKKFSLCVSEGVIIKKHQPNLKEETIARDILSREGIDNPTIYLLQLLVDMIKLSYGMDKILSLPLFLSFLPLLLVFLVHKGGVSLW